LLFETHELKYRVLHNLKKYDDAIILLNKMKSVFNDSLDKINFYKGVEKYSLSDIKGAIADLTLAINNDKLSKKQFGFGLQISRFIFFCGIKIKESLKDFNMSLNLDDDRLTHYGRAITYSQLNLKDSACADLRKAGDMGFWQLLKKLKNIANNIITI
jgi:tetratricopeptide (TPR) repeat protein